MTTDKCPRCGSFEWSRWMKRRKPNDHRQYKFCLDCYHIVYREQPQSVRERVKRDWRKGCVWKPDKEEKK